jgi:hypothetical protein
VRPLAKKSLGDKGLVAVPLSVGYAQEVITPDLSRPVFLAGFDRNRRAQTIHDDLTVRVLALQLDQTRLVLVALDLIGYGRSYVLETAAQIRAVHGPLEVIIASIHTHHGPDTIGMWGPNMITSGVDPAYMAQVRERVVSAVGTALARMAPANLRAASVHVPGIAKNARDPEIVDDELTCLQFVDPSYNQPLVTLMDFPCHPEVLWFGNPVITADYPHFLRERVTERTGAPCIFFAGALGGMMTPDVVDHSFAEAETMGQALAERGLEALSVCNPAPVESLAYRRQEYTIPLKSLLFEIGLTMRLLKGAQIQRKHVHTEAGLLRIGPALFACVPGELLPKLGLEFKAMLRQTGAQPAGVISLANDELGYILPDEDFHYPDNAFKPGSHYEETMSIGPTAGSCLSHALESVIKSLRLTCSD